MFAELLSLKDFAKFATSNDLGRLKTDMLSRFLKICNMHFCTCTMELYVFYTYIKKMCAKNAGV